MIACRCGPTSRSRRIPTIVPSCDLMGILWPIGYSSRSTNLYKRPLQQILVPNRRPEASGQVRIDRSYARLHRLRRMNQDSDPSHRVDLRPPQAKVAQDIQEDLFDHRLVEVAEERYRLVPLKELNQQGHDSELGCWPRRRKDCYLFSAAKSADLR